MNARNMKKVAAVTAIAVSGAVSLNVAQLEGETGLFSIKKAGLSENVLKSFDGALTNRSDSENQNLLAYYKGQEIKFSERNNIYEISDSWARSHDAGPK